MKDRTSSTVVTSRKTWERKNLRAAMFRGTAALLLFVFVTISLHGNWLVALVWVVGGLALWGAYGALQQRNERAEVLREVDAMTAERFLPYAADLLRAQGYTVHKVGYAVEPRVDLLLTRGRDNFVCWLEHRTRRVGAETITAVAKVRETHGYWSALVLSNQPFTLQARRVARRTQCVLIDRNVLAKMVAQYRHGHRVLSFPDSEGQGLRRRK
jgi:hypothetical protein